MSPSKQVEVFVWKGAVSGFMRRKDLERFSGVIFVPWLLAVHTLEHWLQCPAVTGQELCWVVHTRCLCSS